MTSCRLFLFLFFQSFIHGQEWSNNIGLITCPPNEIFYSPCRPCDNLCETTAVNETCDDLNDCTAGCACAPGFYRTSQGACVNSFMCLPVIQTNETIEKEEEIRTTKRKCYEGYCKRKEFCIDAGIGAVCLPSRLTTTKKPKSLNENSNGTKLNSKCQNMKCAHGGMCFEISGEARCFTTPLCRNVLERWYDCMPCENECFNRTIIQKNCSQDCRAGCACRPTFIRDNDGSCTLPIVCLNDFKPLPIINLEPLVVVDTKMDRDRKIVSSVSSLPSISSSSSSSSSSSEEEEEANRPYE